MKFAKFFFDNGTQFLIWKINGWQKTHMLKLLLFVVKIRLFVDVLRISLISLFLTFFIFFEASGKIGTLNQYVLIVMINFGIILGTLLVQFCFSKLMKMKNKTSNALNNKTCHSCWSKSEIISAVDWSGAGIRCSWRCQCRNHFYAQNLGSIFILEHSIGQQYG